MAVDKAFRRTFDIGALRRHVEEFPRGAIAKLLSHWALPGDSGVPDRLRLAVRDRYLNLYIGGQSVARITSRKKGLSLSLHRKYYEGWEKGSVEAKACSQEVTTLSDFELSNEEHSSNVFKWIKTALSYCGDEKLFVDELISANCNVLDVEMALPGDALSSTNGNAKTSPRVDLVTINEVGSQLILNFWEAKCANNKELRANEPINLKEGGGAKVVKQIRRYIDWMALDGRREQVLDAYREQAKVLLEIAKIAGIIKDHHALVLWEKLSSERPGLVCKPGIVVANYKPVTPRLHPKLDNIAKCQISFGQHRKRLIAHDLFVHEIASDACDLRLPALPPVTLQPNT